MAIDRDTAYYKEWRNDRDWKLRFEIIPAGKFVDSSHNYSTLSWVAMKRGAINIKSQKSSFNKITAGVMEASSITVDFDISDLQANLIEMLKQPFYDHTAEGLEAETTNLFILKSDRGSGTISFIEFMGGQKNTLSNEFGILKEDATTFTAQTVTIDAIDVLKLVLEQVPTSVWATNIITRGIANETYYAPTLATGFGYLMDFLVTDTASREISKYDRDASGVSVYMYNPVFMFTYGLASGIQEYLAAWTRSGNPTTYTTVINRTPFYALTLYKAATVASTNAKGTTLGDSYYLVVGKTTHPSDQTDTRGGMLIADKDGESYLAYDYMWDLLKNLCEGSCCKMTYKPALTTNGTGAVQDLGYIISFDRIFANPSNTRQDLSGRFADAHGENTFKFIPSSGVYTSATSEIPNEGGIDLDHIEAVINGTKSDERINAQMIHHNSATADGLILDASGFAMEDRVHVRKLYHAPDSGNVFRKVHESVKIHDGITETTYDNPLPIEYTGTLEGIKGYAVGSQLQSGLAYAVAQFYLSRYSNASQNEIKCKMFMVDEETMPENIGDTVTVPTFTGFDTSSLATIIDIEADWNKGVVDLTFMTRGT